MILIAQRRRHRLVRLIDKSGNARRDWCFFVNHDLSFFSFFWLLYRPRRRFLFHLWRMISSEPVSSGSDNVDWLPAYGSTLKRARRKMVAHWDALWLYEPCGTIVCSVMALGTQWMREWARTNSMGYAYFGSWHTLGPHVVGFETRKAAYLVNNKWHVWP